MLSRILDGSEEVKINPAYPTFGRYMPFIHERSIHFDSEHMIHFDL